MGQLEADPIDLFCDRGDNVDRDLAIAGCGRSKITTTVFRAWRRASFLAFYAFIATATLIAVGKDGRAEHRYDQEQFNSRFHFFLQ